jgi:hypothetical protein
VYFFVYDVEIIFDDELTSLELLVRTPDGLLLANSCAKFCSFYTLLYQGTFERR